MAVDRAWELQQQLTDLAPETQREYEEKLGYLLVGGVLMKAGLADSAAATLARGKGNEEIDPWQELLMYEGAIRATMGDPDGAVLALRQFLAANPQQSFDLDAGLHWWWRGLTRSPVRGAGCVRGSARPKPSISSRPKPAHGCFHAPGLGRSCMRGCTRRKRIPASW